MYKTVDISPRIIKVLEASVPADIIQEREGAGRKMLSYVSGNYVIDELNRAFNYAWSWSIDRAWVQESADHKKKAWGNKGKATNEYTMEKVGPVAHVIGTLSVVLLDEQGNHVEIKKTAAGSKSIVGGQVEQESIFKAAATDAMKKAASLFGIGASLYRDDKEQRYFDIKQAQSLWTDAVKEQYKEELTYLNSLYQRDINVDRLLQQWSSSRFSTVSELKPKAFKAFIDDIKQQEQWAKNNKKG